MNLPPPPMFADVQMLLAASQPKRRSMWVAFFPVMMLTVLIASAFADHTSGQAQAVGMLVLILGIIGGLSVFTNFQARAQRAEYARLEAAEELVQLRRWPQAAVLLQSILSQPTRSQHTRLQALVCFVSVLARFHRFEDVEAIANHLLETINLESAGVHAIKLSRAMALLREDRLFDADRAISDLRHSPEAAESAGLALVELYRDVKTGHPAEALQIVETKRDLIRRQFGHRIADAYVLAASAHDQLNQPEAAQAAYRTATLLSPAVELHRRYPETSVLAAKYAAEPTPPEVAL